jgi:hypothetical protein
LTFRNINGSLDTPPIAVDKNGISQVVGVLNRRTENWWLLAAFWAMLIRTCHMTFDFSKHGLPHKNIAQNAASSHQFSVRLFSTPNMKQFAEDDIEEKTQTASLRLPDNGSLDTPPIAVDKNGISQVVGVLFDVVLCKLLHVVSRLVCGWGKDGGFSSMSALFG